MNISNSVRLTALSLMLSLASLAHANPHLCPTLNDIKKTISDRTSLYVEDYFLGGKYSYLTYFSDFNTNETWYLYYRAIDSAAKTDTDAWKLFQRRLTTTLNPPQYAKDKFYSWDCEYIYQETQIYLIARLMSP